MPLCAAEKWRQDYFELLSDFMFEANEADLPRSHWREGGIAAALPF